jgi:hypothetical protein
MAELMQTNFGPAITTDESRRLLAAAGGFGKHLKIMAKVLAMTSAELMETYRQDVTENEADTILGTVDALEDFRKSLQSQMELARAAQARLFIAGESLAAEMEATA